MTSACHPRLLNPRLVLVALLLLTLSHLSLFPWAMLVTDSGRDLANAWTVAHGGPYPAYGPELFGRWKLGPIWFWLLALPLKVSDSLVIAALFVGALASAKIPLAFFLGQRLSGQTLGLLLAALVALPGWSSVGTLVIAHTSVVESALLATFLLSLAAWQTQRTAFLLAASFMLALALHAHPTTLIAAPVVLITALRIRPHFSVLLVSALVFLLPFTPALWTEAQSGWPQAVTSMDYLQTARIGSRLGQLPALIYAAVLGGIWFAGNFLLPLPLATPLCIAHGLLLLASLSGLTWHFSTREISIHSKYWTAAGIIYGAIALVFIAVLRDATPVWMVYGLAPFGPIILAFGLHALPLSHCSLRAMLISLLLAALALNLLQWQQRYALESRGQVRLPGASIGNITASHDSPASYSAWLSIRQFDALAETLCHPTSAAVLHGDLAMLFDFSQGVVAQMHCAGQELPRLGGRLGQRHLAGIPATASTVLQLTPYPVQFGHVLRTPTQILAPQQGRETRIDTQYRLQRQKILDAEGIKIVEGVLTCQPDEWLVISNLMPIINPFTPRVETRLAAIPPHLKTQGSAYYPCSGQPMHWRIETSDPLSADVFVIDQQANTAQRP